MTTIVLHGRKVVGGRSEGEALVTRDTVSGWGGFDPRTGKVVETRLNALQFPPAAANAVILLAVTLLIIVGLNRIVDVRKEL